MRDKAKINKRRRELRASGAPVSPDSRHRAQSENDTRNSYKVIFDPTGDFRRGAVITRTEMTYNLSSKVFAPGTLFEKAGRRLIVTSGQMALDEVAK